MLRARNGAFAILRQRLGSQAQDQAQDQAQGEVQKRMTSEAAASEEARGPLLLAPAGRREALLLALALALLSCLPVLMAARPQMTDYPSHLARYYIMLDGGTAPGWRNIISSPGDGRVISASIC